MDVVSTAAKWSEISMGAVLRARLKREISDVESYVDMDRSITASRESTDACNAATVDADRLPPSTT